MNNKTAMCLFSSAGIGELGMVKHGIKILISNELDQVRHALYQTNFPETKCYQGNIWNLREDVVDAYLREHNGQELFLVYATPPCQGMSSNGAGRLLQEVRDGNRSPVDQRNRVIIPAMDIISCLRPRWVLFENVPRMRLTSIHDEHGKPANIVDYIESRLGSEYVGGAEVLACEDYGIPQVRKRLITIYTRDPTGIDYFHKHGFSFFPDTEKIPKKTLREAIGHLPPLDGRKGFEKCPEFHPLHYVPVMQPAKYWWVSNTREGDTAFNNQCCNEKCRYTGNALHRDVKLDGRWRSNRETPVYCKKCGSLLPRPAVFDRKTGKMRLINGFHSAYRRMKWDEPATSLTQNLLYEASDNKIHPEQNRVLSLYEATVVQTVADYDYKFEIDGEPISKNLIAEILGESVPPKLIDMICSKMLRISGPSSTLAPNRSFAQGRESYVGKLLPDMDRPTGNVGMDHQSRMGVD
jgi:DNA (cytosine-5)-methyltransferase 1